MKIDLTTMKAIMESDRFALYLLTELVTKKKTITYKGIRLDKKSNQQVEVYIEKTNKPYPPYRVIGFVQKQK